MNKTVYILLFVWASVFAKAQSNLVYNGDFEMYSSCMGQINYCVGWNNPTLATPDYFNTCSSSIPSNSAGFQHAYDGNAYAGFIPFEHLDNPSVWWFEYIQGEFTQPLQSDRIYEISFYVSCAEYYSVISVSKIGAYISAAPISRTDALPFLVTPQVLYASGAITDTAGWTKISGKYMATGNEQYITIGYFSDTVITDSVPLQYFSGWDRRSSYYFVDGLNAIDVTDQQLIANVFTPNNDGDNDLFFFYGLQPGDSYSIYDRWGIHIFEGIYNQKWDGRTTAGINCTDGVYYYVTKRQNNRTIKGFIQLLR